MLIYMPKKKTKKTKQKTSECNCKQMRQTVHMGGKAYIAGQTYELNKEEEKMLSPYIQDQRYMTKVIKDCGCK